MAIKVEAIALGYHGTQLRHPGETFEIKDKKELGKWMREIKEQKPATEKADGEKTAGSKDAEKLS